METKVLKISEDSLALAKTLLENGEVIGMPTETVYGLAGDGRNSSAVRRIFEVKGRPSDNPLIAHVHKDFDIESLCYIERDYVFDLIREFMPGPLTLVMRSKGVISKEAICGGETLAVRMPSHKGCQELLKKVNIPLVAPSANLSKHTSPVTATHVYNDLNGKIPLILDGGKSLGGIESTVLDVTGEYPKILRAGLITKEMIERVVSKCFISEHKEGDKVKSPGVKYTHYRPKCETALYEPSEIEQVITRYNEELDKGKTPYIMCESKYKERFNDKNLLLLGESGEEVASNLYDKLLEGEEKADIIIAISMGREDGVYMGIMNRLKKACG